MGPTIGAGGADDAYLMVVSVGVGVVVRGGVRIIVLVIVRVGVRVLVAVLVVVLVNSSVSVCKGVIVPKAGGGGVLSRKIAIINNAAMPMMINMIVFPSAFSSFFGILNSHILAFLNFSILNVGYIWETLSRFLPAMLK